MRSDFPLFSIVWVSCWAAFLLIVAPVVSVIVGRRRGWSMLKKYAVAMAIVTVGITAAILGILAMPPR